MLFVANCVRPARVFVYRLRMVLTDMNVKDISTGYVSTEMRHDLDWWCRFLAKYKLSKLVISACWDEEAALKILDQQCKQSLRTGYRPDTVHNYKSRANIYIRFFKLYNITMFPSVEWDLIRYARYIAK